MELSEAKEILKDESKYNESLNKTSNELLKNKNLHWNESYLSNFEIDINRRIKVNQAIDIVLKALADKNYISKEYHEMVVKEQNDIIDDLKSKLDNSISRDEVKKVIDEINIKLDNDDFKHDMYMGTAKYEDYLCLVANRHCLEKLLGDD